MDDNDEDDYYFEASSADQSYKEFLANLLTDYRDWRPWVKKYLPIICDVLPKETGKPSSAEAMGGPLNPLTFGKDSNNPLEPSDEDCGGTNGLLVSLDVQIHKNSLCKRSEDCRNR